MTAKEEKLVIDNLNIAHQLAWQYNASLKGLIELEDLQSICFLGLCKAATTYNPDLGNTFTTYSYKVIQNEVNLELRKLSKYKPTVSIYTPIGEDLELKDTISSDLDIFENIQNDQNLQLLHDEIKKLNPRYRKIIELKLQGLTQVQIAKKLNVSQPSIARSYYKIINILRKKFDI